MAKDRKRIEEEILTDERLGEEEDYEEYARMRDAREGVRARQAKISEEEQARQSREYESRKRQQEEEQLRKQDERRIKAYEKKKKKSHPVRNFFLALIILIIVAVVGGFAFMRSQLQTVNSVELKESVQNSISRQVSEDTVMQGYQNIALFGVDSREQDLSSGNNRSDSIMIC